MTVLAPTEPRADSHGLPAHTLTVGGRRDTGLVWLAGWAAAISAVALASGVSSSLGIVLGAALLTEILARRHGSGAVTAVGVLAPLAALTLGLGEAIGVVLTSALVGDGALRRRPPSMVIWHSVLASGMVSAGFLAIDSTPTVTGLAKTAPYAWLVIYAGWFVRRLGAERAHLAAPVAFTVIAVITLGLAMPRWLPLVPADSRPWIEAAGRGMTFAAAFMLIDFCFASLAAVVRGGLLAMRFWLEQLPLLFARYASLAMAAGVFAHWRSVDGEVALAIGLTIVILLQAAYSAHQRLQEVIEAIVGAFGATIDARDQYTAGHSLRVAEYASRFAVYLGWSRGRVERVRKAALLHDIGKIGVSDAVLFKPGRLEPAEFEEVKRHASVGESVVGHIPGLGDVARIVGQDHERWAGGGYPRGLKGEAILPEARLLAILDVFDAITTTRPYRDALSESEALAHLEAVAGDQLEPELTRVFVEMVRSNKESGVTFCYCATH